SVCVREPGAPAHTKTGRPELSRLSLRLFLLGCASHHRALLRAAESLCLCFSRDARRAVSATWRGGSLGGHRLVLVRSGQPVLPQDADLFRFRAFTEPLFCRPRPHILALGRNPQASRNPRFACAARAFVRCLLWRLSRYVLRLEPPS